jgi:fluoride exporter
VADRSEVFPRAKAGNGMKAFLLVAVGGAAGSMLRYALQKFGNQSFPFGTLTVNIAGCFLIGVLWALFMDRNPDRDLQLLLMTGFCGGFTTFSAFTQESMQLIFSGRYLTMVIYLVVSVAGGLLATALGYKLFS